MQTEIMPKPPVSRAPDNPWPFWPNMLKVSTSHEEGCDRMWSVSTRRFVGENGHLKAVEVVDVEWMQDNGRWVMQEKEDSLRTIEVDLVLLSMGFVHPVHKGLVEELGLDLDNRGNVKIDGAFSTTKPGVFAAGDAANGASLVVTAIAKGRDAAAQVHQYLEKD
jgi:glutamate synthase (NADPH/NADH) small chain